MKLKALLLLLVLLMFGCSTDGDERGRVEAIRIEPANPIRREQVRVFVDLYDPYIRPAVDEPSYLHVDFSVTGGELEGRAYDFASRSAETVRGQSIRALVNGATQWTLPDTAGSYKLTAYWDAGGKSLKVNIQ